MFFMIRKHIILHIEIHKPKTIIPEPEFRVPECHFAIAFENNCLQSIRGYAHKIILNFPYTYSISISGTSISFSDINIYCRVLWSESKSWDGICLDINISECVSTMVWSPCPSLPKRDSTLMLRMKSNSQCLSSQPHTSPNIWRQHLEMTNLKKEPPIWNQPQQFIIIKM